MSWIGLLWRHACVHASSFWRRGLRDSYDKDVFEIVEEGRTLNSTSTIPIN